MIAAKENKARTKCVVRQLLREKDEHMRVYCHRCISGGLALNQRLVELSVEKLCHKGCRAVWSDIDALEAGKKLPEVEGLSVTEVDAVISELKSIMSVYQGTCAAV